MRPRIDVRNIVTHKALTTPTKTRILAGGIHSAKQQVVRIDRAAGNGAIDDKVRGAFHAHVLRAVRGADALILSDYGTGLVTPSLVAEVRKVFRPKATSIRKPDATKPIVVDSRYNLLGFHGISACTPNESEVEHALGVRIGDNLRVLARAGRTLLKRTRASAVLITRGSRGMALFEPDRPTRHIPIVGSDQIADVTHVKQIKAAVGKGDASPGRAIGRDRRLQFFARDDASHRYAGRPIEPPLIA
jgi:bifunctional ADP-heptose synthase (sugar kinase/adenylyltransferase)